MLCTSPMGRAPGAWGPSARREEESMSGPSATTSNDAHRAPTPWCPSGWGGLGPSAALRSLRHRTRLCLGRAPCIRPQGVPNATHRTCAEHPLRRRPQPLVSCRYSLGNRASTAITGANSRESMHSPILWVFCSMPGPMPNIGGCLNGAAVDPPLRRPALRSRVAFAAPGSRRRRSRRSSARRAAPCARPPRLAALGIIGVATPR